MIYCNKILGFMTEQKQSVEFDVTEQLNELTTLQPISVIFKGKPREVHFFHRGTAEAFSETLKGISEKDSMKRRKQREEQLLAIVLADLYGSSPYLKRLKRWLWRKRLEHSIYNDVEAVALLEAAKERIQEGKQFDALGAILLAQMKFFFLAMRGNREQLLEVLMNQQGRRI